MKHLKINESIQCDSVFNFVFLFTDLQFSLRIVHYCTYIDEHILAYICTKVMTYYSGKVIMRLNGYCVEFWKHGECPNPLFTSK